MYEGIRMITARDIRIESRYMLSQLFDMELDIREGCHGKLVLRGSLSNTDTTILSNDIIKITVSEGETDKEIVLFNGIVQDAHIFYENGVKQIILSASTHDIKLDGRKNNRSFQNISMTYNGIVEQILLW